jgi:hypothetical protein
LKTSLSRKPLGRSSLFTRTFGEAPTTTTEPSLKGRAHDI